MATDATSDAPAGLTVNVEGSLPDAFLDDLAGWLVRTRDCPDEEQHDTEDEA